MNIYQMAKEVSLERVETVDGLVTMYAALKSTIDAYEELGLAIPDWMTVRKVEIIETVNKRALAKKMSKLKTLRRERERLKTVEEKRTDVEEQIAELEAELNKEDEDKD